ncbi:MAG: hypothetical protein H5T61_02930 [Thermoflexales bacterium]|nr:hypothetical protein [Thermoflexales bacterium]
MMPVWFAIVLILAFVIGEIAVLGTQFWLIYRNYRFSRLLNLGTLTLGLFGVPTALGVLVILVRGP